MMLTSHFNRDPKPKKVAIKALVLSTGLTYQEICRWFRNQRLRNKQQPHMQTQAVMSQQLTQQHAMQLGIPQPLMPMSGMSNDDRDRTPPPLACFARRPALTQCLRT